MFKLIKNTNKLGKVLVSVFSIQEYHSSHLAGKIGHTLDWAESACVVRNCTIKIN
jgi:hypothetical protein